MIQYSFAVIRYIHNVPTDEFVNVGIIMFVASAGRVLHKLTDNPGRISRFFSATFDRDNYRHISNCLRLKLEAESEQLNHRQLDLNRFSRPEQVFEHLLREDSTCFQLSPIMYGISPKPEQRLEKLFFEYVGQHEQRQEKSSRKTDAQLWSEIKQKLDAKGIGEKLEFNVPLKGKHETHSFKASWMNSIRNYLEPISLDYQDGGRAIDHAYSWTGRLYDCSRGQEQSFKMTAVVSVPHNGPDDKVKTAIETIRDAPNVRKVVMEDQFDEFLDEIALDIMHHEQIAQDDKVKSKS